MALPRSLTSLGNFVGPFFSSGGAAYYITFGSLEVRMYKSADPSSTAFAEVDAADNPISGGVIRGAATPDSVDAYQVSDVIHVAVLSHTVPAMGDWEFYWDYFSFNMGTDQWDTSTIDSSVNTTAFATNGSDVTTGEIRIMVRGNDGDIVIVGLGEAATSKGTDYATIYHAFFNGSTWSTPTQIDRATTAVHARYPQLSNDFTTDGDYTVVWTEDETGVFGRAVTGATHTHETSNSVGTSGLQLQYKHGNIVYNDGGTWRGFTVSRFAPTPGLEAVRYDPTSATPFASETVEADITGTDTPVVFGTLLAYDPTEDTRYAIYVVDATPDSIKYVTSVNEATWGGATTHSSPANDTQLLYGHATVGTSPSDGSSTVIGFLYLDNTAGTAYYDEIVIAAGVPPTWPAWYRPNNPLLKM